jgi:hypothetical protein
VWASTGVDGSVGTVHMAAGGATAREDRVQLPTAAGEAQPHAGRAGPRRQEQLLGGHGGGVRNPPSDHGACGGGAPAPTFCAKMSAALVFRPVVTMPVVSGCA